MFIYNNALHNNMYLTYYSTLEHCTEDWI